MAGDGPSTRQRGKGRAVNQDLGSGDSPPPSPGGEASQAGPSNPGGAPPSSLMSHTERESETLSAAQVNLLLDAVRTRSTMPNPSHEFAPRFTGKRVRRFLEDYVISTNEAGWDDRKKCENLPAYCNASTRPLVRKIQARIDGNWKGTETQMLRLYVSDESEEKYAREKLTRLSNASRSMENKSDFGAYFRLFHRIAQNIRRDDHLSEEDKNLLFWKGLPKDLRNDIYKEFKSRDPDISEHVAQPIEEVRKAAMKVLDKYSIYAQSRDIKIRNRKKSRSESKRHRRRHRRSRDDDSSESSDDDWSLDDLTDSDEEDSDKDRRKRSKEKLRLIQELLEEEGLGESDGWGADLWKGSAPDALPYGSKAAEGAIDITDIQNALRKRLPAGKPKSESPEPKKFNHDRNNGADVAKILGMMTQSRAPAASSARAPKEVDVVNTLRRLAEQVEESRNDIHNLMDRRELYKPPVNSSNANTLRCFFCQKTGTHPRPLIYCPEAQKMIRDGYCKPDGQRVILADGRPLPRIGFNQQMSDVIKEMLAPTRRPPQSEAPRSHFGNLNPHRVNWAMMVDGSESESEYSEDEDEPGNFTGFYSSNERWLDAMVGQTEQTPPKRTVKFSADGPGKPYVELPPVGFRRKPDSQDTGKAKPNAPPSPHQPVTILNRNRQSSPEFVTNPNRLPLGNRTNAPPSPESRKVQDETRQEHSREDWKYKNVPGAPRIPMEEPESRSQPHSGSAPSRGRFTTPMRERFDAEAIYESILQTPVQMKMGEFLAVSPNIEKALAADTKLRASSSLNPSPLMRTMWTNHSETETESEEETHRFLRTPIVAKRKRRSSKQTGYCLVDIGSIRNVRALVDTGSTINLVSTTLAANLEESHWLDNSARKSKLYNVSGGFEKMHGRFPNLPISFAGHTFEETLYVANDWNTDFDVILGQPFLANANCNVKFSSNGPSWLIAYPENSEASIQMRLIPSRKEDPSARSARVGMAQAVLDASDLDDEDEVSSSVQKFNNRWEISGPQPRNLPVVEENEDEVPSSIPEEREFEMEDAHKQKGKDRAMSTPEQSPPVVQSPPNDPAPPSNRPSVQGSSESTEPDPQPLIDGTRRVTREEMFTAALWHARQHVAKPMKMLTHQQLQGLYDRRIDRTFEFKLGNHDVSLAAGPLKARVDGIPIDVLFDPEAASNEVTADLLRRLDRLEDMSTTAAIRDGVAYEVCYIPLLTIMIHRLPDLPGLFIVNRDRMNGGFDMVVGMPWLVGIQKQWEGHEFRRHSPRFMRRRWSSPPINYLPFPDDDSPFSSADVSPTPQRHDSRGPPDHHATPNSVTTDWARELYNREVEIEPGDSADQPTMSSGAGPSEIQKSGPTRASDDSTRPSLRRKSEWEPPKFAHKPFLSH